MATPVTVLREATRVLPAVKYAFGIAGVLSAIAIGRIYGLDAETAAFGTVLMIVLMTALAIFSYMVKSAPENLKIPAAVLTWFSLLLLMAVTTTLFLGVFLKYPELQSVIVWSWRHGQPYKPPVPPGCPETCLTHRIEYSGWEITVEATSPRARQISKVALTVNDKTIFLEKLSPPAGTYRRSALVPSNPKGMNARLLVIYTDDDQVEALDSWG